MKNAILGEGVGVAEMKSNLGSVCTKSVSFKISRGGQQFEALLRYDEMPTIKMRLTRSR